MSEKLRYFTFEQANAMVRMIRPMMAEILRLRQLILDRQPEVWPVVEKAAGNGGSREASLAAREFQRLDSLVREIQATGAVIKDINHGLVDFPAMKEEREVYLCWKYGEEEIRFWHEIDTGFASRQPWE
ncbi:MAG: hypothetical protein A2Z16_00810 [Chloroflexi bacterium RBG_16_54_18]|nr:MAG: hypothetical protein A2Z16_00810 [Chloroflexi bacterium RBG_16_54_18]